MSASIHWSVNPSTVDITVCIRVLLRDMGGVGKRNAKHKLGGVRSAIIPK